MARSSKAYDEIKGEKEMAKKLNLRRSTESTPKKPRYVKTMVPLPNDEVAVYFGKHVADALHEVTVDMPLYKGVKLGQLLQAMYEQGRKDGARHVQESFENMMKEIPHKNPGKPKKK